MNGGNWTSPWKRDRIDMKLTNQELAMKFFGARPTREAVEKDWRDILTREAKKETDVRRRYIDRAVDANIAGDTKAFNATIKEARENGVRITRSQLKGAIKAMRQDRATRVLSRVPRHRRGEASDLRRGLDRMAQ